MLANRKVPRTFDKHTGENQKTQGGSQNAVPVDLSRATTSADESSPNSQTTTMSWRSSEP